MIGAKHFSATENSVTFRFAMNKKMNCVKIELNQMDTYDLTFYKIRKFDFPVVDEFSGVYADQLKRVISETIKLDLSL